MNITGGLALVRQSDPMLEKYKKDRTLNAMFLTGSQKPLLVPSLTTKRIMQHRFDLMVESMKNNYVDDCRPSSPMRLN